MVLPVITRCGLGSILVLGVVTLGGCANGGGEGSISSDRYSFAGSASLTDPATETFNDDRLASLIIKSVDDIGLQASFSLNTPVVVQGGPVGSKFDQALNYFYARFRAAELSDTTITSATFRKDYDRRFYVARNVIQDQLLAASVQRCGGYKRYLKQLDTSQSLFFGGLTTILGGAGAIVTGADAARALSGGSGIASGLGAEAQQNIFSNLASAVIIPGIDKKRAELLQDIMKKRCHSVTTYTLPLALADAVAFNNACTMDTGISEGGKSLQLVQNPGMAMLKANLRTFEDVQASVIRIGDNAKKAAANETLTPASGTDSAGTAQKTGAAEQISVFEGYALPRDCSPASLQVFENTPVAAKPSTACAVPVVSGTKPTQVQNAQGDEAALSVDQALYIQSRLGVQPDADFGTKTRTAIAQSGFAHDADNVLSKAGLTEILKACSNLAMK